MWLAGRIARWLAARSVAIAYSTRVNNRCEFICTDASGSACFFVRRYRSTRRGWISAMIINTVLPEGTDIDNIVTRCVWAVHVGIDESLAESLCRRQSRWATVTRRGRSWSCGSLVERSDACIAIGCICRKQRCDWIRGLVLHSPVLIRTDHHHFARERAVGVATQTTSVVSQRAGPGERGTHRGAVIPGHVDPD